MSKYLKEYETTISNPEKPMKKSKINRIWWLIAVLPALFICYGIFSMLYSPLNIQTALEYTMSESVESIGLIVRNETMVYYNGSNVFGFTVKDGERVTSGSIIGETFYSSEQAFAAIQLRHLEEEIAFLETLQNSYILTHTDLNIVLKQTQYTTLQLLEILDSGDYSNLLSVENNLNFYYNRMQIAIGEEMDFSELLSQKKSERDALLSIAQTPVSNINAPISGYFSSSDDSNENNLNSTTINEMSATDLNEYISSLNSSSSSSYIARIQPDYRWYVYTTIPLESASSFTIGRKVSVSFLYTSIENLPAEIISIEFDDINQIAKIGLLFTDVSADTVNMPCVQPICISLREYTGLRIDKRALHIVDDIQGVYIRYGNILLFKPITPIFEDESYYLVPLQPTAGNGVRLYDEIIIEGNDLYNGKLLS